MAIIHKINVSCSCGCGREIVIEAPHFASAACKMRAKRAADPDSVVDCTPIIPDQAPAPQKLKAPAPSGDPVRDAHAFIAAVKAVKGQSPFKDAARCKHGSAIGLCKHGCTKAEQAGAGG